MGGRGGGSWNGGTGVRNEAPSGHVCVPSASLVSDETLTTVQTRTAGALRGGGAEGGGREPAAPGDPARPARRNATTFSRERTEQQRGERHGEKRGGRKGGSDLEIEQPLDGSMKERANPLLRKPNIAKGRTRRFERREGRVTNGGAKIGGRGAPLSAIALAQEAPIGSSLHARHPPRPTPFPTSSPPPTAPALRSRAKKAKRNRTKS